MTVINDPALSKTGGNWSADVVPGDTDKSQSRTWVDGHFIAVSKYAKNADWSIEFIRMACSKQWHDGAGNAPPRRSVLNDPAMAEKLGWPPTAARAIETGVLAPARPTWSTLELALARVYQKPLQGQKTAKQALDAVAADWQTRDPLSGNWLCLLNTTSVGRSPD
jgi:multiple sugar transport system substrate-binding protein